MGQETEARPALTVRGHPTDEELAALTVVMLRPPPEAPVRVTRQGRPHLAWQPVSQGEES